jgi:hypothetical protein
MSASPALVSVFLQGRAIRDRDLEPIELADLAGGLAEHPELWRPLVRFDAEERVFVRLHRDDHLDAWLICWVASQETGLHDHDDSSGAVRVMEGRLTEDRLVLGGGIDTVAYRAGEGFRFDASRIHDVRHAGDAPAVSLHLYSPPLLRMGFYEVGEDGWVARRSASYLEELPAS